MKVCIDPGHGGRDPGACDHGVREADLNLAIAQELRVVLERAGHQVLLTRTIDRELAADLNADLKARSDAANRWGADVVLSIHCNASGTADPGHTANGVETYALPGGRAQVLAQSIHRFAVLLTGAKDRAVRTDRGFWILRKTTMPAVLIECGYITNKAEVARLAQPAYRSRLVIAMAAGLLAWSPGR